MQKKGWKVGNCLTKPQNRLRKFKLLFIIWRMNTLLFLSLVASVLLFARVDADPCGFNACSYTTCSRTLEDLQRTCGGGIISADSCGCCGMCAKLEGESCGGYHDIGGTTCDIGLTCQPVGDKKFIFGGLGKCVRINPMTTVQVCTIKSCNVFLVCKISRML